MLHRLPRKQRREIVVVADLIFCDGLKRGGHFFGQIIGCRLEQLNIGVKRWMELKREQCELPKDVKYGLIVRSARLNALSLEQLEHFADAEDIRKALVEAGQLMQSFDSWFKSIEGDVIEARSSLYKPPPEAAD